MGAAEFHAALEPRRRRDAVVRLGYVADDELARWLAGAQVLAFPSVYEGFGFPPLEAMAAGRARGGHAAGLGARVVGDGAVLVAPRDVDALAARPRSSVLGRRRRPRRAGRRGRRTGGALTWEACGEGLAALYADAADGAR